ncbi:unnamed protein product [Phytophthora lilii]|uniref:Unnamed protein product n=1 Tax=Phytophthora lilii TaxID=2077276 RepID=A0A9W7CS20_9STRA|nr:unnamed protein product [Phytophthora lilii]
MCVKRVDCVAVWVCVWALSSNGRAPASHAGCGVETQLGTELPVTAEVPNGDKLPGYGLKDSLVIDWLISTGPDVSESTHQVT